MIEVAPVEIVTVTDLIRRGPAFANGGWYFAHSQWKPEHKLEACVLAAAGVDLEQAADILGRPPTNIAHYAAEHFNVQLPRRWWDAIRKIRVRKPSEPGLQLAYPFIVKRRDEHADILTVNALVPHNMPGREDICQEILLALMEGVITIDQIKANRTALRPFIRQFRRDNMMFGGNALSFDQPLEDGRSWQDVYMLPGTDRYGA